MTKILEKIVQSKNAPSQTNVVWDDGKALNVFRNGKWVSTGLTSEQQNMIQKVLDAYGDLPDDLNSLKEIINTPADFLNNEPELGGLINMPFGYAYGGDNKVHYVYVDKFDEEIILAENIQASNILISYHKTKKGSPTLDYNLYNDLYGKENAKSISGPLKVYFENSKLILQSTGDYYPGYVIFRMYGDKTKLSKDWIDTNGIADWEANEGEEGYIKNRTHYIDITIDYTLDLTNAKKGDIFDIRWKRSNTDIDLKLIDINQKSIIGGQNDFVYNEETILPMAGPSVRGKFFNDRYGTHLEITSDTYGIKNIWHFGTLYISLLAEKYITEGVARVRDYELAHIKLDISEPDEVKIKLQDIRLTQRLVCDLYSGTYDRYGALLHNAELYNLTITGIKEGKLVKYDINSETGEITLKQTIDLELIASQVHLDVCTSGSTEAARNLELLNKAYFALGDHFTVNIDAGIGVAKFIPESGGEGHITTAEGVQVHYTIGADGSVIKSMEIDIVALYNKVEEITVTEN